MKMTDIKRATSERRSGKDRRKRFTFDYFFYRKPERRKLTDRRLREERRNGWVRVSKWSSVFLRDLKIAKFLK
jgi:hypothetical protein